MRNRRVVKAAVEAIMARAFGGAGVVKAVSSVTLTPERLRGIVRMAYQMGARGDVTPPPLPPVDQLAADMGDTW